MVQPWHQERAIADPAPVTPDNGNILQDVRPEQARRVHLLGVAGTGMGSFAGMLKAAGYDVTGSDENVYPPMSDMLAAWGIEVMTPVRAGEPRPGEAGPGDHRQRHPPGEPRGDRGARAAAAVDELPRGVGRAVPRGAPPVVVVGTHGKTTTSALMAHVLVDARASTRRSSSAA